MKYYLLVVAITQRKKGDKEMPKFKSYDKFKGWLVEHKIKQSEVAGLLGIAESNLNLKLNGKQDISIEQVRTICSHYGISADEYFIL